MSLKLTAEAGFSGTLLLLLLLLLSMIILLSCHTHPGFGCDLTSVPVVIIIPNNKITMRRLIIIYNCNNKLGAHHVQTHIMLRDLLTQIA
jgi:predicted small secreted protein